MIEAKLIGLENLYKKLDGLTSRIDVKQELFLSKLAEIGIKTADIKFKTAQYDGFNDVAVNQAPIWVDDKTLIIEAAGNAVAFIEFGTGVNYTQEHPTAGKVGAVRGAYGQGKGKQRAWGYYGVPGTHGRVVRMIASNHMVVLTEGNPPARALYDAGQEIRRHIKQIATEVFGS